MLVAPQPIEDERGFFARWWCADEFARAGLNPVLKQANVAYSRFAGTLRGLHYQLSPHQEAKLFRCVAGAVFDVVVDLRPSSTTYLQWGGYELSAENRLMLYVPEGCAHGYLALRDHTEIIYLVSESYTPGAERGIRWDDPTLGVDWPLEGEPRVSAKDNAWPDFKPGQTDPVDDCGRTEE